METRSKTREGRRWKKTGCGIRRQRKGKKGKEKEVIIELIALNAKK